MSEEADLAKSQGISLESLAKAPLWLAGGLLGFPSLIALGAAYFIARTVIYNQRLLVQYNLSELHQMSQMDTELDQRWQAMREYIVDDLRAQYQTCVNAAKTDAERSGCLSPQARMDEYGIAATKKK
jgi:hypothetical protein